MRRPTTLRHSLAAHLRGSHAATGGGGANSFLARANFVTESFIVNDATVAVADMFEENLDWGSWDPTAISPGDGLVTTDSNGIGGKLLDALAADYLQNGVTMVADCLLTDAGNQLNSYFIAEMVDLPEYTQEFNAGLDSGSPCTITTPSGSASTLARGFGHHKIALSLGPTGVSMSCDGEDTISLAWSDTFAPNSVVFAIAHGTVLSLTFYALKQDADLPALSAL